MVWQPLGAVSYTHLDVYKRQLLTGADTISDLTKLKSDLGTLLSQYGLTLHKWASNEPRVVASHDNLSLPLNKQGNAVSYTHLDVYKRQA